MTASGKLLRIARGTDSRIYFGSHIGAHRWKDEEIHRAWLSMNGVALASHAGQLWCFHRSNGSTLLGEVEQNGWWGDAQPISGPGQNQLMDEPAAASHDGKLLVMYRRS